MPGRVYISCAVKHGGWYKTTFLSLKPVLAFQTLTLATLGNWATTHQRVFFLGKNCSWTLLPGSIWLRTPITWYTVYQLPSKFQNTFWFFKMCWWLTGLLRLYDASQLPGRHTRYFNTMLKILVDRALMRHISFLFDVFHLTLDRFTCCVHVTITDVNNLFPDFRSIYAVRFDFDFIHYKQSACLLFIK